MGFVRSPKVSVLVTVRNGRQYLGRTIESILAQTYGDFELVIVDDGSEDGTRDIIEECRQLDSRVVPIYSTHVGRVAALNLGMGHCRGEYVAINDADDVSKPNRIEIQVEYLESHPDVAVVGSWVELIDDGGNVIGYRRPPIWDAQIRRALAVGNPFVHSSVMYRMSILRRIGGFDPMLKYAEDYDIIDKCLRVGKGAILPMVLVEHRRHGGQTYRVGCDALWRWRVATQIAVRASFHHCRLLLPVSFVLYILCRVGGKLITGSGWLQALHGRIIHKEAISGRRS